MTNEEYKELIGTIIRRFQKHFENHSATYSFSFDDGVIHFLEFIKTPVSEESLAALDYTLLNCLYRYFVGSTSYKEKLSIIKEVSTSLDPFLKKIIFFIDTPGYYSLGRKGLKDVILKLDKLIKDYRNNRPDKILHDPSNILQTDRGKPYDLNRAYKARNMVHESPELDEEDIAIMFKSIVITYLYSFFEYCNILVPHIKVDSSINREEKIDEKNKFYRCMDEFKDFINNSIITIEDKEIKGINITKAVCEEIAKELSNKMVSLGRELLRSNYKDIDLFKLFLDLRNSFDVDEIKKIESIFISEMEKRNKNERWEYIKNYVGSVNYESPSAKDALKSIGSINFYKIKFEEDLEFGRQSFYNIVIQKITREYGNFTDGFLTKIGHILKFISTSKNSNAYIDDFNAGFTSKFDYLLLLYLLLPKDQPTEFVLNVKKYADFEKITNLETGRFMLDSPDKELIQKEIDYALDI